MQQRLLSTGLAKALQHWRVMHSPLAPGRIFTADYRTSPSGSEDRPSSSDPIRILQWNIERGYELEKVIEELKNAKADIIALQEVDVGCERSSCKDTGVEIAKALAMNYAFVCEFEEIKSPLRNTRSQGGGFHGNAILSKWDFSDTRALEHRCHPIAWDSTPTHPLAKKEPRKGRRLSLAATVLTPQGPIVCYSVHLEVFCGMLARIAQFSDILQDSRAQLDKGIHHHHQAILGDLNTMGHAIARFSPSFCTDKMRFRNLGQTEAQFWDKQVLQQPDPRYQVADDGKPSSPQEAPTNVKLQQLGAPDDVCRDALNPGFVDPFDPLHTVTLDNPDYRFFGISLMKGKLDWLLLRKCLVLDKSVGNHDYAASDHKWLMASIQLQKGEPGT